MHVAVASGAWRHGSILSVRVGDIRRQAPLEVDTALSFPKAPSSSEDVQVDVYARVGSTHLTYDAGKQMYDLDIHSDGFSSMALRMCPRDQLDAAEDAASSVVASESVAAAGPLDLAAPSSEAASALTPKMPSGPAPAVARPSPLRPGPSSDAGSAATSEERYRIVRQNATEYIERHNLRQLLQDLFQRTVRDQPNAPMEFMQKILSDELGGTCATDTSQPSLPPEEVARLVESEQRYKQLVETQSSELETLQRQHLESNERRQKEHEDKIESLHRQARELEERRQREHTEQVESLRRQTRDLEDSRRREGDLHQRELDIFKDKIRAMEVAAAANAAAADAATQARSAASDATALEMQALREDQRRVIEQQLEQIKTLQKEKVEAEARSVRDDQQRAEAMRSQDALISELRHQLAEQEARRQERDKLDVQAEEKAQALRAHVEDLQRRLQRFEYGGSCTPADAAAGVPQEPQALPSSGGVTGGTGDVGSTDVPLKGASEVSAVPPTATATAPPAAPGDVPVGTASTALPLDTSSTSFSLQNTGAVAAPQDVSAINAGVGTMPGQHAGTHFLSQLMASTYAAPILPTMYCEPREDEDTDGPVVNADLLISISECKDPSANGPYARVGDCNSRPLYRMLGPQPRYMYFAAVDKAWQGWWIADKTGSHDYIEWFSHPSDAQLPIYCDKGTLGSRVQSVALTKEIAQKIGTISCQQEKTAIRDRFTEAYGQQFAKLDGSQRGLMAKTSPVVAVAHALEAQQRAIQLLHAQLAAATQHREAAELHAQTMEEAFEELQLRLRASLPGTGAAAVAPMKSEVA
eukprot:TRINITY_DN458_c1_g1_i1.p1 TRINITY_DN458_c1_g1~~TRINITY_DN458_c1_g1_i1.p1  ORF type:complete len:815 (-),score=156.77 TRINITY_DN458_c1_g1_i1:236-2680(-)